ncbi:MAG: hypothetical protein ABL966_12115 [Acidimicrobiales bacterium]
MGLLTPKGEDDEEQGDISIAGLEHLDGGGDGDDEITYELDEWTAPDLAVLRDRLTTLGAPHSWEGTTLVVAAADEAWVDRIMDQVDEDLSTAVDAGADEHVAYDLTEWDDESCVSLLDALATEEIPYGLDGDELLVASTDEARVDEIFVALTTPGAQLTLGGPASFEAMSALFIAADELSHDPDDSGATTSLVDGARAAAGASAPYGMETGWWDGVVARAGALADLLESPTPDLELVADLAAALRTELRPYI